MWTLEESDRIFQLHMFHRRLPNIFPPTQIVMADQTRSESRIDKTLSFSDCIVFPVEIIIEKTDLLA